VALKGARTDEQEKKGGWSDASPRSFSGRREQVELGSQKECGGAVDNVLNQLCNPKTETAMGTECIKVPIRALGV